MEKDNIDRYQIVEDAIREFAKGWLEPSIAAHALKSFRQNHPELFGLKWDKKDKTWVYKYRGGEHRVIFNKKTKGR